MYTYSAADVERFAAEPAKGSQLPGTVVDTRSGFARDRARVLHSAALRRLANKTQVVRPTSGDTPRTRLTHSLEVAQIARGIGQGLGLDGDLVELAGLCHDIGHPPYGHNGEVALNTLASDFGGFEGNAQTLRILSRLEPKVIGAGLNLTRASLDAAIKYPWSRAENSRKYGVYEDDREIFEWVRRPVAGTDREYAKSMEAQIMDAADDIAYSVHDVEDGILSGRITLTVLDDLVELAELAAKGAAAFGGEDSELIAAADRLSELPIVAEAMRFTGSYPSLVGLKAMTSELVGRFVGAAITASRQASEDQVFGRHQGSLVLPPDILAEVRLLKTIAVLYVMDAPAHQRVQDRQRSRIFALYDYLRLGAPGSLDPQFAGLWESADGEAAQNRVVIDQIASMTESRLERTAKENADMFPFFG
ncbi:MAG: deoxyguanosinetriphosphate triphosphohydrolase [Corynebacterium sp.]|nr:deoxyguanosinetriphosphate triphosphohydrolase [Corynebacterium sp.]